MGKCSSGHIDNLLAGAQKDAAKAKELAQELNILPTIRSILSYSCSNVVKSHGLVIYKSGAGGWAVKQNGDVVYHGIIPSKPDTFHFGAWVYALDEILASVKKEYNKVRAENNRKGFEYRQLKRRYSL